MYHNNFIKKSGVQKNEMKTETVRLGREVKERMKKRDKEERKEMERGTGYSLLYPTTLELDELDWKRSGSGGMNFVKDFPQRKVILIASSSTKI